MITISSNNSEIRSSHNIAAVMRKRILLYILIVMCVSYEASAIGNDLDTINRKWLGKLEIPNGPKLTVTIELFKKADGTFGAVMGSPDQGRMGIPVDKFDFSDNIIRFDVNASF